jgi:hypothetical protein
MNARHELFIDERHLLPEVAGSGRNERCEGVDVTRDFQNSSWNRRENAVHCFDDAVVESVYCAHDGRLTDRADDQGLDARRLDLDVHGCPVADGVENVVECRNLDAVREWKVPDLGGGEAGDVGNGCSRRIYDGVVVNDDDAVASSVHVQLDCIGPELDRPKKRGDRVLGERLMRTAVGDLFRDTSLPVRNQLPLGVVVLVTMSAKL